MNTTETLKKEWFILLILLLPFFISMYFWDQLPDEVPTHFNFQGEADDYGPKWMVAYMIPGIALGVYLMLIFLPAIDPKKRIESAQKPIAAIRIITSVFMLGIYGVVMALALGYAMDINIYIRVGVGALIFVLGNYLNSVKPNYFIGIRTPWTLESPEVWRKTHRIGSRIWMVGGLIMMIAPFVPGLSTSEYWIPAVIAVLAGIPVIYSFIVFKQIEKSTDA